jgi:hypothetical protein
MKFPSSVGSGSGGRAVRLGRDAELQEVDPEHPLQRYRRLIPSLLPPLGYTSSISLHFPRHHSIHLRQTLRSVRRLAVLFKFRQRLLFLAYSVHSERRFRAIVNSPVVSAAGAADVCDLFTMRSIWSAFFQLHQIL